MAFPYNIWDVSNTGQVTIPDIYGLQFRTIKYFINSWFVNFTLSPKYSMHGTD